MRSEPFAAPAAISIDTVTKRFGRILALDGISVDVPRGNVVALLGPNGAGKTTLLDILCTIAPPDSGTARVAGFDVTRDALMVRRALGVVFQEPTLDTRLTVRENLNFHGMVYQMRRAERRERMDEMLELVELTEWKDTVVRTLSSGMRRRLEIARALMHGPQILFLDEPTVGLDAQSRARIWDYLHTSRENQDLTIVVTTHYIEEVNSCDVICVIDHGRILARGTPDALKSEYGVTLLRVTPRSEEARVTILARFPESVAGAQGQLVIPMEMTGGADAFLAEFGNQLEGIAVDQPSLESVFLTLTGRDLREAPPAPGKGRGHG